jgi:hypothetical protein
MNLPRAVKGRNMESLTGLGGEIIPDLRRVSPESGLALISRIVSKQADSADEEF